MKFAKMSEYGLIVISLINTIELDILLEVDSQYVDSLVSMFADFKVVVNATIAEKECSPIGKYLMEEAVVKWKENKKSNPTFSNDSKERIEKKIERIIHFVLTLIQEL